VAGNSGVSSTRDGMTHVGVGHRFVVRVGRIDRAAAPAPRTNPMSHSAPEAVMRVNNNGRGIPRFGPPLTQKVGTHLTSSCSLHAVITHEIPAHRACTIQPVTPAQCSRLRGRIRRFACGTLSCNVERLCLPTTQSTFGTTTSRQPQRRQHTNAVIITSPFNPAV
jgi:hypothetical protein